MNEAIYERHSDEKDYIYFAKTEGSLGGIINVGPHFHNAVELKLIIKGKCSVKIGSEVKDVTEGELAFVAPGQIHQSCSDVEVQLYTLVFDSIFLYTVFGKGKVLNTFMSKNEKVFKLLKEAFDDSYEKWGETPKQKRIGFVYRVLGIIAQYYEAVYNDFDTLGSFAINIMQYIQNNYFENLNLSILSEKFGYSKSHFSILFNKYIGMNLRDYINRCRIDAANRMMLENKDLPLHKVAEKVGYDSLTTFYRAYKKYGK